MVSSKPLAEGFPEWGPRRVWKRELGGGYSGLLYRDGRLFTAHREGSSEVVIALAADDGAVVWQHRHEPTPYPDMTNEFGDGPNATPLILGERLFMISIAGRLHCLELNSGKLLWEVDLHERYGRQTRIEEYGYSAPPMAYAGQLLVAVGGKQHAIVGLDPASGEHLWGSPAGRVSYAPPVLIEVEGQDQYLFFSPTAVIGMDPNNGEFLWSYAVKAFTENNLTPALYLGDRFLWVAGQLNAGTRVLRLPIPGSTAPVEVVWERDDIKQAHWHSYVAGDYVYGSLGGNFSSYLGAVNWRNGQIAWKYRGFHLVKGVMANDTLYFTDENGQLGVARVSPKGAEILASNQLLDRVSWTPPIIAERRLFARNQKQIVAVELDPAAYRESKAP